MKFTELEKEEFRTFLEHHPLKTFFQTPEMEELGKQSNWKTYYVGVKDNDKILCATRMMAYKNRIGQNYFYAPRGLLIDYHNKELLSFFTHNLKQYIKKKKGYKLHIDPTVIHLERDSNGKVKKSGINNEICTKNLKQLGYIHYGYKKGYNPKEQCRWVYVLDIENKTEEELLKGMKPTTRNMIRRQEKNQIIVRELSYEELDLFKKVTEETSTRKNFYDKPLSYYQTMYQLFAKKNQVKFVIAQIDTDSYLNNLIKEQEEIKTKVEKLTNTKANQGKIKEHNVTIQSLEKKIKKAKEYRQDGKLITLAASMFMTYGEEVIYYHSGNYEKYIELNGQTAIQWYMIKYALKHNFKRYNFYGISGIFDGNDEESGVYEYKKGFGGDVEEYIGDFDLPINWYYYIDKWLHKK